MLRDPTFAFVAAWALRAIASFRPDGEKLCSSLIAVVEYAVAFTFVFDCQLVLQTRLIDLDPNRRSRQLMRSPSAFHSQTEILSQHSLGS